MQKKRVACRFPFPLFLILLFQCIVFNQSRADVAEDTAQANEEVLLDETEYPIAIEEIVVVGRQPEWRLKKDSDQVWRPKPFGLADAESKSRITWLPEYNEDEREQYQGVRDRTGEKAVIKIFEWEF
jgi:hypothetical protein